MQNAVPVGIGAMAAIFGLTYSDLVEVAKAADMRFVKRLTITTRLKLLFLGTKSSGKSDRNCKGGRCETCCNATR